MRILIAIVSFVLIATPASARELCFEREFTENTRYDVDVGWGKPNPLDPNPDTVEATIDPEALLVALRDLKKGWHAPSTVWPKSAVTIQMFERGIIKCQAIYTRDEIYVQDDKLYGFLRRPLSVSEYFALDDALDIGKYRSRAQ